MEKFKTKEEFKEWFFANKERITKERRDAHIELWNNLPQFETPQQVPRIPIVSKEEYVTFYVPKLIAAGAIPKDNLIDGQIYIGDHRNSTVAKWVNNENKFHYWRHKFGSIFIDTCNHFQDDNGFALFVPIRLGTEEDFENSK